MLIAGHYSATYGGSDIGSSREGFNHDDQLLDQPVVDDEFGSAPCDGIQDGCITMANLDYIHYDKILSALYTQLGTAGDVAANVGKPLTSLAKELVLTAKAGTNAAAISGRTRTYTKAIVGTNLRVLMGSKLRQGPCTFKCFPDPVTKKTFTDA